MAGLFGLLLGASAGSFLATWWLRRDRGEDWIWGRSRCDRCGVVLAARDLLPIVSWLVCRGRCRSCQAPIDPRHVVVEVMAAGVVGLAFWLLPLPAALVVGVLGLVLLALALVDLVSLELPDTLLMAVAALGLLALLLRDTLLLPLPSLGSALLGAAGAAAALGLLRAAHRWLCGREGLGTGDIALAAAGGLWLGAAQLPLWFLLASTLGLLFAVGCGALRDPTRPVPFAPALGLALFVLLLHTAQG